MNILIITQLKSFWHRLRFVIWFLPRFLFKRDFIILRRINIYGPIETLRFISDNRVSVSRFGDGEFALLSGNDTQFQSYNPVIAKKLRDILLSNQLGHIVCIPHPWRDFKHLKFRAIEYWGAYLDRALRTQVLPFIKIDKQYYDSYFTRFYIDWQADKIARETIPLLKSIWDGRDICIVEGEHTKMGVGNDLFNNVKSISRILCPSRNAFDVYDSILYRALLLPKTTLVLVSLGMTATCLAYDLSINGFQAIDAGHMDIEYEWFRMKATNKVSIKGKDIAEVNQELSFVADDPKYQSEVIAVVSH